MAEHPLTLTEEEAEASSFDHIARDIFAPIYPVLAEQILRWSGISEGRCLDLGAGTGRLGFALAEKAPGLSVLLYDKSEAMLSIASRDNPAPSRIRTMKGMAESLPFDDESVDLAVSRGSVFFWEDQLAGIDEIYRVLRPGGAACIGGGFGSAALLDQIEEIMAVEDPGWHEWRTRKTGRSQEEYFESLLGKSVVPRYRISKEDAGLWIKFRK